MDGLMFADQLNAARYAMSRVRFTVYAEKILRGEMLEEDLPQKMAEAMQNYDEIVKQAGEGSWAPIDIDGHDYAAEFRDLVEQAERAANG